MKRMCLIPARGGSRRIPKKNVKKFKGTPAIGLTIKVVESTRLFDTIFVSTDDKEIAEISQSYGANVPWLRSPELSDDFTDTDTVLFHETKQIMQTIGKFDQACCVYPVNLFLTKELIIEGLNLLEKSNALSSFPVVEFGFPIQQAFQLNQGCPVFKDDNELKARSQDLTPFYHDTGMFYWYVIDRFMKQPKLFGDSCVAFPVDPMFCQDINTEYDWHLAELKIKLAEEFKKDEAR
jgi:pseudaminic acid cytidylyltransferase